MKLLKKLLFYYNNFIKNNCIKLPLLIYFLVCESRQEHKLIRSILACKKRRKKNGHKSALFLHNCYYNFFYLAKALRKRGWDALAVSIEPASSANKQFYHGEDLNLYLDNADEFNQKTLSFLSEVVQRFNYIHFYGAGSCSFFPKYFSKNFSIIPWDFLELKRRGIKIGYTHSGCNDLIKQSTFYKWSNGACSRCVWKGNPLVCSDDLNRIWGKKISHLADLISVETDPPLDYKGAKQAYLEPLTYSVDPDVWSFPLIIPENFKIPKEPDEFLVYHSVGNYNLRTTNLENFKGTEAITQAISRLKKEGYNIHLVFIDDVASINVKYFQAQCDIVVDQLNYGRYGANAREAMMLGLPVICNINKNIFNGFPLSTCVQETPIIHSDIESIYDTLKYYYENRHLLSEIGIKSRQHALKWWSSDSCAERFERVYTALIRGESFKMIRKII